MIEVREGSRLVCDPLKLPKRCGIGASRRVCESDKMLSLWLVAVRVFLFLVNPDINVKCEQRVTIKFLMKSGCSPIECWRKLKDVWAERTMSKTQVHFWHKRFKEGEDSVRDAPRTGRPKSARTAENIEMISGMIEGDSSLSMHEISLRTGLSQPVVAKILRLDLKLTCKCAKFVLRELTEPQKWTRKTMCEENIEFLCSQDDPEDFVKRIITGDEMWVSTFEAEGKLATTTWSA